MYRTSGGRELSRRRMISLTGLVAAGVTLGSGCASGSPSDTAASFAAPPSPAADLVARPESKSAKDAWIALATGNARFAAGKSLHPHDDKARRDAISKGQQPFACVLGCIDSRVPPELVFDAGLGDIVTVRAAGEVLDSSIVGSVEFAVKELGVPLVLVLGHTDCGAVKAAIDMVRNGVRVEGELASVVRDIEASVRSTPYVDPQRKYVNAVVNAQAQAVARELIERSPVLANASQNPRDGLAVVPALYDLNSGYVTRLRGRAPTGDTRPDTTPEATETPGTPSPTSTPGGTGPSRTPGPPAVR